MQWLPTMNHALAKKLASDLLFGLRINFTTRRLLRSLRDSRCCDRGRDADENLPR